MADIVSDFLQRAKKFKGDPQIQAALAAEFAVAARAEPEQSVFRAALDAAALLHWFDAGLLEQMLELPAEDALKRIDALKSLPFVERYRQAWTFQGPRRSGWAIARLHIQGRRTRSHPKRQVVSRIRYQAPGSRRYNIRFVQFSTLMCELSVPTSRAPATEPAVAVTGANTARKAVSM